MELLGTVDWLLHKEKLAPQVETIRSGLATWKGGENAAQRKLRMFDERLIDLALERLNQLQQLARP
jgi:hypothetical protein